MTKKQGYSTIVCFITVSIITIILLLNGFIIHADSGSIGSIYGFDVADRPVMNLNGYASSSIYVSGILNTGFAGYDTTHFVDYFDTIQFPSSYSPSDYPYFVFCFNNSGDSIYFYAFDEFIDVVRSTNGYLFSVNDDEEHQILSVKYSFSNDSWSFNPETDIVVTNIGGVGDVHDVFSFVGYGFWFYSNQHLYAMTSGYDPDTYSLLSTWRTNPELFTDVNYSLYDSNGDFNYENPLVGGGGSMSEDIEKGLYLLKGSCIYLENKSFNDGTLHVNALFSDIQKSNPNLQVRVKGTCTYSFEQTSQSAVNTRIYVGEYSNSGDSSLFGILWPGENYTTTHTKTVNCTYGLLGSDIISIDSFDGGIFTKPLSQVNSSMFTNDIGGYTMATFGGANIRPIANAFDNANTNQFIIRNMSINTGTPISFNTGFLDESKQKTDVYLTDVKYNFELYVVDVSDSNNIEWSDVIYSYSIDMLNGTASVGTDGTLTYDDLDNNFDGDIPSEYLPSTDVNSSGGSASSLSGGNNQVVTINGDDSAKYLPSLINKLVPSTEGDGGLSEDFQNLTNSNGWIQYMSATLYFVPASVWTTLNTYFITFIGIIGVAFIIRIILDLL